MEPVWRQFTPMFEAWRLLTPVVEAWEQVATQLLDVWLQSPLLHGPMGAAVTATMKLKRYTDDALAQAWAAAGLSTRREQEHMLHTLNQMQSKLADLEERLIAAQQMPPAGSAPALSAETEETEEKGEAAQWT